MFLGRPFLVLSLTSLAWAGCHAGEPTRDRPRAPDQEEQVEAPPKRWPPFERLGELRLVGSVDSAHPAGDYFGAIRVNREAEAYGSKRRDPLPPGARVVEALSTEVAGTAQLHYVMEKQPAGYFPEGGDWAYLVIGKEGEIQAEGKLTLCARCHAEAPREHLFESFRSLPPP